MGITVKPGVRWFTGTVPLIALAAICTLSFGADDEKPREFKVHSIGYGGKTEDKTTLVLDKKYEPGLLRMEKQSEISVLWWFDRNDTPEKRSILQIHPRGNPGNPLAGVFATHPPVRPNVIAMTRCKIISVKGNVIEIESIDAFPDKPVLDTRKIGQIYCRTKNSLYSRKRDPCNRPFSRFRGGSATGITYPTLTGWETSS